MLDTNQFKLTDDFVPIDNVETANSSFDFSQYNDDETKKEVVMIEKTNTVIVG